MTLDYLTCSAEELPGAVRDVLERVAPLDADRLATAADRQADLTKPAGSLGSLELAVNRVCAIGSTLSPRIDRPYVVVFAADHGVAQRGVSAWPQDVTGQMFAAVRGGVAAINVIARQVGADVAVVNMGLASTPPDGETADDVRVVERSLGAGTADFVVGPAMTRDVAQRGFLCGAQLADEAVTTGATLLVAGDLGIANTCSSAALIALAMGVTPQVVTGRGAGADDEVYQTKLAAVQDAVARHQDVARDPWAALAAVGGFEHAAMAGFYAGAAARGVPVVLDGVISCAAATVVAKMRRAVTDYMIAGHRSAEPGASAALTYLGLEPVVDAGWRLGEGTGAALAIPLLQSGCATMTGMARFSSFAIAGAAEQPDGEPAAPTLGQTPLSVGSGDVGLGDVASPERGATPEPDEMPILDVGTTGNVVANEPTRDGQGRHIGSARESGSDDSPGSGVGETTGLGETTGPTVGGDTVAALTMPEVGRVESGPEAAMPSPEHVTASALKHVGPDNAGAQDAGADGTRPENAGRGGVTFENTGLGTDDSAVEETLTGLASALAAPPETTSVLAGLAMPGPVTQDSALAADPATSDPALTPINVSTVVTTETGSTTRPEDLGVVVGTPGKTVDFVTLWPDAIPPDPRSLGLGPTHSVGTPRVAAVTPEVSDVTPHPEAGAPDQLRHAVPEAPEAAAGGDSVNAETEGEDCPDTEEVPTVATAEPAAGDFVGADYEVDLRSTDAPTSPSW